RLEGHHGTVGAVALDAQGNLAAATSTGGYTGKLPGRVGDSPIIGAGTYADDNCAVSGTGLGEAFIRGVLAYDVAARIRYLRQPLAGFLLLGASLGIGIAGYEYFEGLAWRDAFLNSAMLLGGMGPVDAPKTDGGKLFAGLYALFCGLVVIISVSVVLAPVVHR